MANEEDSPRNFKNKRRIQIMLPTGSENVYFAPALNPIA